MGFGKDIDWDALHRAEEQRTAEEAEQRSAYYASLGEKQARRDAELAGLLGKLGERVLSDEKARMEMEQAEEERKALEAVREKYRRAQGEHEWTASKEDPGWHAMAKSLFGEG